MDDVLEVRFCVLEFVDGGTGDMPWPWGKGIASGEEGMFWVGRGDMRAVAETSGDAAADLLWSKIRPVFLSYVA